MTTRLKRRAQAHPWARANWTPRLADYFCTAYTNVIAFSPTDQMPLNSRDQLLFTLDSAISLLTILVTVSRAIKMLS